MDLDVNLDLNPSSTDIEIKAGSRGLYIDSTSSHASSTMVEFSPSNSSMSSIETRRPARRSSITPSSSNQIEIIRTTITKEENERKAPLQASTRRRRSRVMPEEVTRPSTSTRPRHSPARRYSPSPEVRSKLKSIAALLQNKAKQQEKSKMVFHLSQLPFCCDATSGVLLECLVNRDASDFVLFKKDEVPSVEPAKDTIELPTSASTSTASGSVIKQEVTASAVSSDDEDEEENAVVPFVRMADIGAAPFTGAPLSPITIPVVVKSRKRPRSSVPVIKLPRRRTLGELSKVEIAGTSVQPSNAEQNSPKVTEVPTAKELKEIITDVVSTSHSEKDLHTEVVPARKSKRMASESGLVPTSEAKFVSAGNDQTSDSAEPKGLPVKRMKKSGSPSASDRPKRSSAGKTLSFLAKVTKRRRSALNTDSADGTKKGGSSFETATDVGSQSCLAPAVAPATSSVNLDADNGSLTNPPLKSVIARGRRSSAASGTAKSILSIQDEPSRVQGIALILGSAFSSDIQSAITIFSSTRSTSVASTDQVIASGSQESISNSEHTLSGNRGKGGGRGQGRSFLVRARGARRSRISADGRVSPVPASKSSPNLQNLRRSSRSHIPASKTQESEQSEQPAESRSNSWSAAKNVNPNSALGILRRVSRYTRPIRSPSPQPLTATVIKAKEQPTPPSVVPVTTPSLEVHSQGVEKTTSESSEEQSKKSSISSREEEKAVSDTLEKHGGDPPEHPEKTTNDATKSVEYQDRVCSDVPEVSSESAVKPTNVENVHCSASSGLENKNDEGKLAEEVTEAKKGRASSVAKISVNAGRISSRAVRPSSRFLNADFVSPLRKKRGRRPKIASQEVEVGKASETADAVASSKEEITDKDVALEQNAKIPLTGTSGTTPLTKSKVVPSTVEKLGVSINAVMDRLLAEVCQDGITRHSAIINKREKRKRNIEKARERVHRLKEERAARLASGYVQPSGKTQSSEPNEDDLSPRARNSKHRLMQKDFLYPSLKRETKAEKKRNEEIRRQRSRNVMNQLAESTREKETPPASRRNSATVAKIRPREPSPFDPDKGERLRREAEQREKQKKLTMPISFNTFLSSKTTMLTAQPLLQPQRSNDRPSAPDHFYRELLCESAVATETVEETWNEFDMDGDDGLDVTTIEAVHIPKLDDYVAPPEIDESAEPVAASIEQMLMRPTVYAEEDGISYLQERALEQPELRRDLLVMAIDCISALHVARLSASGREAAVVVYNAVTTQASKMRDVICMFSNEREEAVYWLHRYLIEMLPVELLASYLFLLRHTRLLNCQVKSIVRSTQNDSNPWPEITHMIIKYIELNVVEPDAAELDRTIASGSLPDVIFVLVAPNISVGDFSVRDRHYDPVYKWLREMGNPASTVIRLKIDESFSTAISEMFFTGVNTISRAVTKLVREHKQKRIVLVGWGTSCCFNHVVLNTVAGVSAVIDLGFPLLTIDGMRGVVPTGLVVIGHANNMLAVSCSVLSRLRITQRVVNRCIVEQICDFLSMEWTKRERSRLVPLPLNDTFKIDLMQLKLDEKAAQANRKPRVEESSVDSRGRKKKLSGTPLPSPIPRDASPSPLPLSQLDSVRSNFQNLLKKAGTEKPPKWPEDRSLISSTFKEPRLPAKPGSAMASPVPARTESPNLVDPASISLT
ncbi:unnamed protein product [Haemonchus placei]|uniref:BZIP domain-containing protein n=1 Tax=Haemonchus placei TaxID=6290 RepID=A0A158QQU5_HAEPC|nr:unnamed protein product [Haemonchus placei]